MGHKKLSFGQRSASGSSFVAAFSWVKFGTNLVLLRFDFEELLLEELLDFEDEDFMGQDYKWVICRVDIKFS